MSENTHPKQTGLSYVSTDGPDYYNVFIACLADFIEKTTTLKTLELSGIGLETHGARTLARALEYNSSLETLNLSFNKITPEGAQYFSESLQHNTTLKKLDISRNPINKKLRLDQRIILDAISKINPLQ